MVMDLDRIAAALDAILERRPPVLLDPRVTAPSVRAEGFVSIAQAELRAVAERRRSTYTPQRPEGRFPPGRHRFRDRRGPGRYPNNQLPAVRQWLRRPGRRRW